MFDKHEVGYFPAFEKIKITQFILVTQPYLCGKGEGGWQEVINRIADKLSCVLIKEVLVIITQTYEP